MTVTAAELYARAARIIGSRTGLITSGSATTAVLGGLIGTTGDNTIYGGWRIIFPDAGVEADKERFVTSWADATGTATFPTRADATPTGERYILVPTDDYTLNEYRLALEKCLYYSRRTYRQVIPLTPNLELYPLSMCDWLDGAGDIDAAWLSTSPVMLHNEDFLLWQDGPDAAPDGYTLTGVGATIARRTGGMRSAYKAHIEAGGVLCRLTQPVPDSLVAWASGRTQTAPVHWPVRPWAWASTPDANSVRAFVFDGTTYHYTDYFDSSTTGLPIFKETEYTPALTDTAYTWGIEIAANAEADVHVAGEVQNTQTVTLTYSLKQQGSQAFNEVQVPLNRRNVGGLPTIELPSWPGAWYQLIAYVRRPFAAFDDDTYVVEDQYARGIVSGLVRWLLDANKPNQNRARLDQVMQQQAKNWTRFMQDTTSLPVPTPLDQWTVVGA